MKFRNARFAVMLCLVASVTAIAFALPANADRALHLAFVSGRGPADALAGQSITSSPFNPTAAGKVQVELLNTANNRVTNLPVTITLTLRLDSVPAAGLTVTPATTFQGIATFDPLSVGVTNVAEFTDYTLVAVSTSDPGIATATSAGFDIWEAGTNCGGGTCSLNLPTVNDPIPDTYRISNSTAGSVITASSFSVSDSNVDCDGYEEFTSFVVWHEYSGSGKVFVVIHTARNEMKADVRNGQTSVQLCVGLSKTWNALAVPGFDSPAQKDTDGDGTDDLFVGLAPKCPKKSPQNAAPCITRQYGDGNGGNYTEAWLPGGDPPRRT